MADFLADEGAGVLQGNLFSVRSHRLLHSLGTSVVGRQERLYFAAKLLVTMTGSFEEVGAFSAVEVYRTLENSLDLTPALRVHGASCLTSGIGSENRSCVLRHRRLC
jgi:hypothetical protein